MVPPTFISAVLWGYLGGSLLQNWWFPWLLYSVIFLIVSFFNVPFFWGTSAAITFSLSRLGLVFLATILGAIQTYIITGVYTKGIRLFYLFPRSRRFSSWGYAWLIIIVVTLIGISLIAYDLLITPFDFTFDIVFGIIIFVILLVTIFIVWLRGLRASVVVRVGMKRARPLVAAFFWIVLLSFFGFILIDLSLLFRLIGPPLVSPGGEDPWVQLIALGIIAILVIIVAIVAAVAWGRRRRRRHHAHADVEGYGFHGDGLFVRSKVTKKSN